MITCVDTIQLDSSGIMEQRIHKLSPAFPGQTTLLVTIQVRPKKKMLYILILNIEFFLLCF